MKTWRAALAVGGLWELIRFLLFYAAISRLLSPALGSAQFLLVPLSSPVLALVAGYAVLAFGAPSETLARLISLAKLLEVVAGVAAVVALFLKEVTFDSTLRLVLLGSLAADLVFLFVIRWFTVLLSSSSREIATDEGSPGRDRPGEM